MSETASYRWVFLAAAAVALGVAVAGLVDLRNAPYAGYAAAREFNIVRVRPGSPAAAAGLRVGDRVKAVGGIQITDTKALWRRPRAEIGETRTYCVERDGEIREIDVTFGPVPRRRYLEAGLSVLVGLCFLVFPLWAYQRAPSTATAFLALFGVCFCLAFFPAPYSRNFFVRTLGEAVATIIVVAGFAFLIHYLMLFPKRRRLLDKSWAAWLIYLPAALVGLFILGLILIQPDFTAGLRLTVSWVVLAFTAGYFGAALVAVVQSYRHATPEERSAGGITMMLAATAVGLLPMIVSSVVRTLAPRTMLPGEEFYALTLGLIPITFALAALRRRPAPLAASPAGAPDHTIDLA